MSKRRKFSAQFNRGAVEQASQLGVSCAQVARQLGIRDNLLTRWKREAQSQGKVAFGGTGTPHDEELAQLKRELARVVGFFVPSNHSNSLRLAGRRFVYRLNVAQSMCPENCATSWIW